MEILFGWHRFNSGIGAHIACHPRLSAGLSYLVPGDVLLTAGIGHTAASADFADGGEFSFSVVVAAGLAFASSCASVNRPARKRHHPEARQEAQRARVAAVGSSTSEAAAPRVVGADHG